MGKKYIVGEKACFTANGRVYGPGDEIDEGIFKNPAAIAAALKSKNLIEKPVALQADNKKTGSTAQKGSNDDTGGGNAKGGGEPGGDASYEGGNTAQGAIE